MKMWACITTARSTRMSFCPLKGTVTSITPLTFFPGFAVMEIIRSNGKTKRIHFSFTGSFCLANPCACTPGGAARMATARAGEGLSSDDPTIANRQGELEQDRARTDSGFRGFHFQRPPPQDPPQPPAEGSGPRPRAAATPTS